MRRGWAIATGHSVKSYLPKTAMLPEVEFEWKIPKLTFQIEGAEPQRFAAEPRMLFRLRITEKESLPIHSIILRADTDRAARRRYLAAEQQGLVDLFGTPER